MLLARAPDEAQVTMGERSSATTARPSCLISRMIHGDTEFDEVSEAGFDQSVAEIRARLS